MTSKAQQDAMRDVKARGFNRVLTWTDEPNTHYESHSHSGLTTLVILRGELTIAFPDDNPPTKEVFGPGSVLDVEAGRKHEVWISDKGCTSVIGE